MERDITFEIRKHVGVISESQTGWRKELNLVSWNGGAAKWDIREWSPDRNHMSRGLTLKDEEMKTVLRLVMKEEENAD